MRHDFGFSTRAIHAGQRPDPETGSRAMPIYATTSFVFEDAQQAADLFALQTYGNIYTRIGNPTTAAFEERLASLEGGLGALATASGQAAQVVAILTLCSQGDHVVAANNLYGGTYTQFDVTLRRMGIDVSFVNPSDLSAVEAAFTDRTRILYGETIGNPRGDVLDLAAFADIAHRHDTPFMVDNTFATPYLCRPIEHGADIVVHSATKFIGGHGTVIGGAIVESGAFPYDNGRFPSIVEPSPAYHGLRFWENFREFAYLTKARTELLRDLGPALSPFNSFLLLLGLETLPLRMQRHVENAASVARFLAEHPGVGWVSYPIFPDSRTLALAERYTPAGPGAVFTFGVEGGYDAGVRFIEGVELASHLANVG
ncbi:MAG: O-acetylhomoserine aminocarboxypropyltransferase/cysteine synthase family protein, partial [Acidimicrobiia bacterium]